MSWKSPHLADDGEFALLAIIGESEPHFGRYSKAERAFTTDDGSTVAIDRVAGAIFIPREMPAMRDEIVAAPPKGHRLIFRLGTEALAARDWPFIPRCGECVFFPDDPGEAQQPFLITQVAYGAVAGNAIVVVIERAPERATAQVTA